MKVTSSCMGSAASGARYSRLQPSTHCARSACTRSTSATTAATVASSADLRFLVALSLADEDEEEEAAEDEADNEEDDEVAEDEEDDEEEDEEEGEASADVEGEVRYVLPVRASSALSVDEAVAAFDADADTDTEAEVEWADREPGVPEVMASRRADDDDIDDDLAAEAAAAVVEDRVGDDGDSGVGGCLRGDEAAVIAPPRFLGDDSADD